jgi:hypothetical protein
MSTDQEKLALAAAKRAKIRAADPSLSMYELVHCAPSADGVGRFALFKSRLRFDEYVHAFVYAQRSRKVDGLHYAILRGTLVEVEKMPGIVTQHALLNFITEEGDAKPDQYRFGVAIVDAKTGIRVCDEVDGEAMRFVHRETAEGVLAFAKKHLLLPNYAATGAELRVVDVNGMDDFKFESECEAQMREWKKGVKQ